MTGSFKHRMRAFSLLALLAPTLFVPAMAHYESRAFTIFNATTTATVAGVGMPTWVAGNANGRMQIGLILVDAAQPALPDPASLDFPATADAIRCESQGGHRECQTPFRGPVKLSRDVSGTRCVEGRNWGWREGAVWVDGGCAAVFVRTGES